MSYKCLLEGMSSFSLRKAWHPDECKGGREEKRLRASKRIFSPFERVVGSVKRREGEESGARVPPPLFFFFSHSRILVAEKVQGEEEELRK